MLPRGALAPLLVTFGGEEILDTRMFSQAIFTFTKLRDQIQSFLPVLLYRNCLILLKAYRSTRTTVTNPMVHFSA